MCFCTVQSSVFFHQPAHPRGEGATINRLVRRGNPPAGRNLGGSAADFLGKTDCLRLSVFNFIQDLVTEGTPRIRGGI